MSISLSAIAIRQLIQLRRRRGLAAILPRSFSSSSSRNDWRKDTEVHGTEVYVYTPDSKTIWPDPALGIFSVGDPKFSLPGNVGSINSPVDELSIAKDQELQTQSSQNGFDNEINYIPTTDIQNEGDLSSVQSQNSKRMDILEEKTAREHQAQTLYSAHDFIHFTTGAESYVCSEPVLLTLSNMNKTLLSKMMEKVRFELHECPSLLKKELLPLFPGVDAFQNPNHTVSIITMAQETQSDMSIWTHEMETERDLITDEFVKLAKELCARIKSDGYWADFIDPSSGIPYFGHSTNTTMFETDDKYRLLGFRIEDLGCCKVICHKEFGRKVFVGTMVTSVPVSNGIIQQIFCELDITNLIAFQSKTGAKSATIDSTEFNL